MLDWNPFPYKGYIDANNHFLNSLLGGFFVRLFNSEAMWVCRLANVLIFPVFYWSVVGFRKFFKEKSSYLLLLVSLTCTVFLLDFFSLARGYGLAWGFLLLALISTANYIENKLFKSLAWAVMSWILCVYANLSLITVSLIGMTLLQVLSIQQRKRGQIILIASSFILLSGAIYYALFLQEIGKLYLGNESDFIATTLHNLSTLLFSIEHLSIDIVVVSVFALVIIKCTKSIYNNRFEIKVNHLFYIFLSLSVLAIFAQNFLLSVNFPEDRSATFLVIFFYGSISFLIDQARFKRISQAISSILFLFFIAQVNLTHTRTYYYEHMDKELISLIPPLTEGIPTSTGGRFWSMDNELIKVEKLPAYTFQLSGFREDTLTDYIIHLPELRPFIEKVYSKIHEDQISGLALYKRKEFLKRRKLYGFGKGVNSKQEYIQLHKEPIVTPCFIRITGNLNELDFYDQMNVVLVAQDSLSGKDYFGKAFSLLERIAADETGNISFDFTYTIKKSPKQTNLKYSFTIKSDCK
ncbi:MAG: hypothetical protein JKY48_04370 [Flavobacteriales bacterium]|nr:hypothetical protein [Flavobacteriales bacterium]